MWKKRMFGLSDGIDRSGFVALMTGIGVAQAIAAGPGFARVFSETRHLAGAPSGDISDRNRAYSAARDGNDWRSFSGTTS